MKISKVKNEDKNLQLFIYAIYKHLFYIGRKAQSSLISKIQFFTLFIFILIFLCLKCSARQNLFIEQNKRDAYVWE